MATGMFGANTDELRAIAGEFGDGSSTTNEAKVITASEVNGVMWMGIDAERFKMHYATAVAPMIRGLSIKLAQLDVDLVRQADEQDDCSEGRGGGNGGNQNGQNGQNDQKDDHPFKNEPWYKWYKKHKDLVKWLKMPRVAIEAFEVFAKGRPLASNWAAMLRFEDTLSNSNFVHKWSRKLGDIAQLNFNSKLLARFGIPDGNISKGIGKALEKVGFSESAQKTLFGKQNRIFGKGLSVLGIGLDAIDAHHKFTHGDPAGGWFSVGKAALGAGSLIPGPVGVGCTAVSTGIFVGETIYKNWDTISQTATNLYNGASQAVGNAVNAAGQAIDSGVKAVGNAVNAAGQAISDAGKAVGNMANDAANAVKSLIPPLPKFGW